MTNALKRLAAAILAATFLAACGGGDGRLPDDGDGSGPPGGVGGGPAGFSVANAVTLMQLCLESYQMLTDFQNGKTFTLPAPYTLQAQVYASEAYPSEKAAGTPVPIAFIATSGTSIYVVFRGTKTISEWVTDATFSQMAYPYVAGAGKTETGFTTLYAEIRSTIIQKLTSLAATGAYTTMYVSGHSLGAALAVVAAPDLAAQTQFKRPVVYTFAGPRAGDPVFALLYNGSIGNTWRVVNTFDEVPKLPGAVTILYGPPPERTPELLFYDHVDSEYPVTFGGPIRSVAELIFNHSSCNYYSTLCALTSNPGQCTAKGQGLDGCSFP